MARAEGVDEVLAKLDGYIKRKLDLCVTAMEAVTLSLEAWAKTEHTFTNQTSDTSNSIRGFVAEVTPKMVRGVLSAGMDYDVFLELARSGRWAFLLPTLENHEADIMQIIAQILAGGDVAAVTATVTGNADVGQKFAHLRASTKEERHTNPEEARQRDRAYRDAVKQSRASRNKKP